MLVKRLCYIKFHSKYVSEAFILHQMFIVWQYHTRTKHD